MMKMKMYSLNSNSARAVVVAPSLHDAFGELERSGAADWGPFRAVGEPIQCPPQRTCLVRFQIVSARRPK